MNLNSKLTQCWSMELKKNQLKKDLKKLESTEVNLSNPWPGSWKQDNQIKNKLKQIMKSNSQST
jgi:hypothetical protein